MNFRSHWFQIPIFCKLSFVLSGPKGLHLQTIESSFTTLFIRTLDTKNSKKLVTKKNWYDFLSGCSCGIKRIIDLGSFLTILENERESLGPAQFESIFKGFLPLLQSLLLHLSLILPLLLFYLLRKLKNRHFHAAFKAEGELVEEGKRGSHLTLWISNPPSLGSS
jgi:hypothetical protein